MCLLNISSLDLNRPKEEDFGLYLCICFSLLQDPETHFCNFIVIITIIIAIVCVVSNGSAPTVWGNERL